MRSSYFYLILVYIIAAVTALAIPPTGHKTYFDSFGFMKPQPQIVKPFSTQSYKRYAPGPYARSPYHRYQYDPVADDFYYYQPQYVPSYYRTDRPPVPYAGSVFLSPNLGGPYYYHREYRLDFQRGSDLPTYWQFDPRTDTWELQYRALRFPSSIR